MPHWIAAALPWAIALAALIILAPLAAALGRRHGRTVKRTAGLALIMLGFGQVLDPPSRHIIEATTREEEEEPAGDPPAP